MRAHQQGFSLAEIAIALLIIALLLGGSLQAWRVAQMRAALSSTRATLEEAREALYTFAVIHKRLPCPAVSANDGNEDFVAGQCAKRRGLLPWVSLGVPAIDAWNSRLSYLVSDDLGKGISLSSAGNLDIVARDAAGTQLSLSTASASAFALWSHGVNRYLSIAADGSSIANSQTSNTDEISNSSQGNSNKLWAREASERTDLPGGAIDDIVIWGSRYVLLGRLLGAGQLP